jgi:hypothetical protein
MVMLPRDGRELPAWRQKVMPALMAGLRCAIVYAIFRSAVIFLWSPPSLLHLSLIGRASFGLLLLAGVPLFLWPRTCLWGGVFLSGAVGCYEWLWRSAGLPPGGMPWLAVALIVVLVAGERLAQIAQRRLYDAEAH